MPQPIKKTPPKQAIDISNIATPKLRSLMQDIEVELKKRGKEDKQKAFSRMQDVAAEYGLTLEEVLGGRKKYGRKVNPSLPPKYCNPTNPQQTWNGHGPRPNWLKALLESGMTLKQLEVPSD